MLIIKMTSRYLSLAGRIKQVINEESQFMTNISILYVCKYISLRRQLHLTLTQDVSPSFWNIQVILKERCLQLTFLQHVDVDITN